MTSRSPPHPRRCFAPAKPSTAITLPGRAQRCRCRQIAGLDVVGRSGRDGQEEGALAEGTTRIEAFSDGVFSIASTLLILEIRIPHAGVDGGLWASLVALWPSYFAFALSFFVILVTWITHHDLMRLVRETTHFVLLANGCALLYVTFIPFPTAVLAANLGGPDTSTAVALYCGTFVFGSAAFNLLVAAIA